MKNKTDPIFSVEHQFQLYALRVRITRTKVSPVQWIETRRAFFGAWGQLLFLLRDEIGEMSDDDGIDILQAQTDEVGRFWSMEDH